MSIKSGMAALNLEFTDQVPRTEYSAHTHWDLIKRTTGICDEESINNGTASRAFMKHWDYAFMWNILVHNSYLGTKRTSMGHAEYAAGGTDRNNYVYCPFEDEDDVLNYDPFEEIGEIDINAMKLEFENHYKSANTAYPDTVNMTGIYITCISGIIELFGWDMLLAAAGADPKAFGEMTNRYCKWMRQHFEALALSDVPVVMIHDDIVWTEGAFMRPDWYRQFVFPNYDMMFEPLHKANKKILYTSDGNYTEFIDDIAKCGVDGFVLEPLTDMQYIADKYGKTHSFVGNADTRILLSGTKEDIYNEVKRCMDIGKKYPGFIMAVGNHIPANTPVDNCLWYDEFYRELGKR